MMQCSCFKCEFWKFHANSMKCVNLIWFLCNVLTFIPKWSVCNQLSLAVHSINLLNFILAWSFDILWFNRWMWLYKMLLPFVVTTKICSDVANKRASIIYLININWWTSKKKTKPTMLKYSNNFTLIWCRFNSNGAWRHKCRTKLDKSEQFALRRNCNEFDRQIHFDMRLILLAPSVIWSDSGMSQSLQTDKHGFIFRFIFRRLLRRHIAIEFKNKYNNNKKYRILWII